MTDPKAASATTTAAHGAAVSLLNFDDAADFERANRGLVAQHPTGSIELEGGGVVWDTARHDFVRETDTAPETVHPGLWRQSRLNMLHGLFQVSDTVWQARGYDISNITFIAGEVGWVIIDPLTTAATAKACLDLANETLGERPVTAVIYTHSHVDHYGGVLGVTSRQAVANGDCRVIAPEGFLSEVVKENVIAGVPMARRATYQFGILLPPGPRQQVNVGLGTAIPFGASELIAPTEEIAETGEEHLIDGVRVIFQSTPDTEAPAEMNFFFPDLGLLCMAENCTHTLHNLYPIRGAQVRDSLAWSKYINEALNLFGPYTDTMFASHHWPRFGREDVEGFLIVQRDVYRWLHDQTIRLASEGYVATEIAETLSLPNCFANHSHVQGYYGTVSHNAKSIYQRYLGWYDANPANLNPHPPEPAGQRYVEFMGGADEVLSKARRSFDEGDYRWVAQVVNHVVFADPTNVAARELQADALEQLGYQAESGTWRNAYLTGAHELRNGSPKLPASMGRQVPQVMTAEQIFDLIGVRFDPDEFEASTTGFTMNWHFDDLEEDHVLGVLHETIHHHPLRVADNADVVVSLSRETLGAILGGQLSVADARANESLLLDGDADGFAAFMTAAAGPEDMFAIIEP
ncbi:MAG: MBL fold metallo-hydrolase [Acidobacteria bacterium]|nr:MBL fold metallo-hydrolase [Acidobacteriota bacterium]